MSWTHAGVHYVLWSADDPTQPICPLCDCLENVYVVMGTRFRRISAHFGVNSNCRFNRLIIQRSYFHEACHRCPNIPEHQLCAECKHMRLRHLIQCLLLADFDSKEKPLGDSKASQVRLSHINLILGSVQSIQERSSYCETCRMFAGGAREVMEQEKLSSDSQCYISIHRNQPGYAASAIGGVKCSLKMQIFLTDWKKSPKSAYRTPNKPSMGAYYLD